MNGLAGLIVATCALLYQDDVESLRKEIEKLRERSLLYERQLEIQMAQVQELTLKLKKAQQEKTFAAAEAERTAKDFAALEEEHIRLARARKAAEDPFRAKAVAVQVTACDAGVDLVVLSAGFEDGVRLDQEYTIHRAGAFVAKVVVNKVDRKWSAAKVSLKKDDPRVGDTATPPIETKPARPAESSEAVKAIREELDEVRRQVRELSDRLLPSWSKVGAAIEALSPELKGHLGIDKGMFVRRVEAGSKAEKAGLKAFDVIAGLTEAEAIDAIEAGRALPVVRGGKRIEK